MQTNLADFIKDTPAGREADAILRSCVHCGFCTATCPTFQLLGDELDGPRGRIYLIKQMLEGQPVTRNDPAAPRPLPELPLLRDDLSVGRALSPPARDRARSRRRACAAAAGGTRDALPALRSAAARWIFKPAVRHRPVDAAAVAGGAGRKSADGGGRRCPAVAASSGHRRRMIALAGCVQPTLTPNTNAATARVLDRLGIELIEAPRLPAAVRCATTCTRRRRRSTTCAR
jgi:glycolate oxidase iron-sulfur subunit